MKKATYLIGILFASLAFCISTNIETFATDNANLVAENTAPSKFELEKAIEEVKSLPGYSTYAPMSNAEREQATPLFREYRYLAELVKTGETMISDYANQTPEDLNTMLNAAKDAVVACTLIFKNANSNPQTTPTVANSEVPQSAQNTKTTGSNPAANKSEETTKEFPETSPVTISTETKSEDSLKVANDESRSISSKNSFNTTLLAHTTTAFVATGTLITNRKRLPLMHRR